MLPKITRGTLAEQVTERLLEYIEVQGLKPGDLLPSETALASGFGVSRPVVREALKNLEGKGFIEIVNGKGALVRPIDSDPLRLFFQRATLMDTSAALELMEVRKGLEVQAAVLAAQRRDAQDLEGIGQVVHAMRQNMDDLETFAQLDVEFHLRVASASHNMMMVYLVQSIRDVLHNTINAGLRSRGSALELEAIQRTHETLYQNLVEGNIENAMHAMEQHFDEAINSISNPQS